MSPQQSISQAMSPEMGTYAIDDQLISSPKPLIANKDYQETIADQIKNSEKEIESLANPNFDNPQPTVKDYVDRASVFDKIKARRSVLEPDDIENQAESSYVPQDIPEAPPAQEISTHSGKMSDL